MQVRVIAEGVPTAVIRVPYNKGRRLFFLMGIDGFQLNYIGSVIGISYILDKLSIVNQHGEIAAREDGNARRNIGVLVIIISLQIPICEHRIGMSGRRGLRNGGGVIYVQLVITRTISTATADV